MSDDWVGRKVTIEGVVTHLFDSDPHESTIRVLVAGQYVDIGVCSESIKSVGDHVE